MRDLLIWPVTGIVALAGCTYPSQQSANASGQSAAIAVSAPVASAGATMSVAGAASTASGDASLDAAADILWEPPVATRPADGPPVLR